MQKGKSRIRDILSKAKASLYGTFSDVSIELYSNTTAFVTGCTRLKEYSHERISLDFKRISVVIEGEYLEPESLINGQMAIKGIIREVRYVDNSKTD